MEYELNNKTKDISVNSNQTFKIKHLFDYCMCEYEKCIIVKYCRIIFKRLQYTEMKYSVLIILSLVGVKYSSLIKYNFTKTS